MSRPRWQAVADALRAYAGQASEDQLALAAYAGQASEDQLALAAYAGLVVNKRLPQPVVAVLLRRRLRGVLHLPAPGPSSRGQLEYVRDLAGQVGRRISTPLDDREIVDAWVKAFHALRAARSLHRLRPCVGDVVEVAEVFGSVPAEISSISADGRLNFKGGGGYGQRPHEVVMRIRASSPGTAYEKARYEAAQAAALRREPGARISLADLRELRDRYVHGRPTATDVAALSEALQDAADERPLQAVLQRHPQLLTHMSALTEFPGVWLR